MSGPFARAQGHEQVVYGNDPDSGLRCIIAVHSTQLGPGMGGVRFHPYPDEEAALVDVLRLSRAMTYKAAAAGLDVGGGKACIIGDPATDRTEPLLRAYGRFVASLGGRYVTACDVGTKPVDLDLVGRETRWATGGTPAEGGSGDSGVSTAVGLHAGLRACAAHVWGSPELTGRHVAVQGVGKVGRALCERLHAEGARLTVADTDAEAAAEVAERTGAQVVAPERIHAVDCDVLSPNALGATLTERTVAELDCQVVAGGANNQLADESLVDAIADRGIVFAPDYLLNAGGLIQVADELHPDGPDPQRVAGRLQAIGERTAEVLATAERERTTPWEAATRVAERRIAAVGRLRGLWLPTQQR